MEDKQNANPWLLIKDAVKREIDRNSYETWFDPTIYIGQESNYLYIKVPNSYFKDWLSFHYLSLINKCSVELFGKSFEI